MLQASLKWIAPILAVLALAAVQAPSARAAFMISISETGGPSINVADGGPLDSDGLVNGVINVVTDAAAGGLNFIFSNFNFGSVSANESQGAPGSNDVAFIAQNTNVARTDLDNLSHTLTITATETSFTYPQTGPKNMVTSLGYIRQYRRRHEPNVPEPVQQLNPGDLALLQPAAGPDDRQHLELRRDERAGRSGHAVRPEKHHRVDTAAERHSRCGGRQFRWWQDDHPGGGDPRTGLDGPQPHQPARPAGAGTPDASAVGRLISA